MRLERDGWPWRLCQRRWRTSQASSWRPERTAGRGRRSAPWHQRTSPPSSWRPEQAPALPVPAGQLLRTSPPSAWLPARTAWPSNLSRRHRRTFLEIFPRQGHGAGQTGLHARPKSRRAPSCARPARVQATSARSLRPPDRPPASSYPPGQSAVSGRPAGPQPSRSPPSEGPPARASAPIPAS